jgi:biopolymer transport protein TolR
MLVRGDRDVPYGKIMEVMGLVGQAGFTKVSLIAQSPGGALPASPAAAPAPASGTPQ